MDRIYLNNDWQFSFDHSKGEFVPARIPHTVKETPFHYFSEEEYQTVMAGARVIESKVELYRDWCAEGFTLAGDYPGAAENLQRAQELAAQILGMVK